jgi:hypothetical protein
MTPTPPIKIRPLPTLAVLGVGIGLFAWAWHYRSILDAIAVPTADDQWHIVYMDVLMGVSLIAVVTVGVLTLYAAWRNAARMTAEEEELAKSTRELEESRRELEIKRMAQRNLAQTAGNQEEIARIDAEIAAANRAKHDQWLRQ